MPPDPTVEEVKLIAYAKTLMYQKLPDPTDKFIVAFAFDMGYSQEETAIALGLTYKSVWKRIKKIRRTLSKYYELEPLQGNEIESELVK